MTVARHNILVEVFCGQCNLSSVGDEYHTILEHNNHEILHVWNNYLPEYFGNRLGRDELGMLMQSNNTVFCIT